VSRQNCAYRGFRKEGRERGKGGGKEHKGTFESKGGKGWADRTIRSSVVRIWEGGNGVSGVRRTGEKAKSWSSYEKGSRYEATNSLS